MFRFLSCCPYEEHTFGPECLAREFTDKSGVHREVIAHKGGVLRIRTTWGAPGMSGESREWNCPLDGWEGVWNTHLHGRAR